MSDETTHDHKTVTIRLNGVGHAFLRELGCRDCPQCSTDKPRASTSASLFVQEDDRIVWHALFDFGAGVVGSLIDRGIDRVDCLLNTQQSSGSRIRPGPAFEFSGKERVGTAHSVFHHGNVAQGRDLDVPLACADGEVAKPQ